MLDTGEKGDLSRAVVEYQFSDERLSVVEGSNTIVVSGNIRNGFTATATVKATLDGVTVESRPVTIQIAGSNIATLSNVAASSSFSSSYLESNAMDREPNDALGEQGRSGRSLDQADV